MSSSSAIAGPREAALGVSHGRRRIVVDRAEIALPVDQRQAQREILRHAHQRVVDRGVAVRVIFAHHVADDARRLHVLLVGRVPVLVHRVEDAPMHRLEAVARVRAAPAPRSRSSRNRGSCASSLRRSRRGECPRAGVRPDRDFQCQTKAKILVRSVPDLIANSALQSHP